MRTVESEIEQAIKALKLQPIDISLVEDTKTVYLELLNHFVKSGDRKWWWEDFKQESFNFKDYDFPFRELINIIPKETKLVWFMAEDDEEDYYPIYNCNPAIIGECSAFEYYVIDKDKEWLLCENHHNRLIGVGDKLKRIKDGLR